MSFYFRKITKDGRDSGKIQLEGKFERNDCDRIDLELDTGYGPVKYIYIGHDNSGRGAGWYLDRVVIHSVNSGLEQTFDCMDWIEQTKEQGFKI